VNSWERFYVSYTMQGGYTWWVRGDQIAAVTELMTTPSGPRSRIATSYGHTCEVMEEAEEVLLKWSESVRKADSYFCSEDDPEG
jgi:hypothetical protein